MRRLVKFLRLGRAERRLRVAAWATLLWIKIALTLLPFKIVYGWVSRLAGESSKPAARGGASPVDVSRALQSVCGYVPGGRNCLARALAGKLLITRRGYAVTLRVGVARLGERIQAHAWLEHDGRVLIGQDDAVQFTPFPPDLIK
jgi:hypothetical protein